MRPSGKSRTKGQPAVQGARGNRTSSEEIARAQKLAMTSYWNWWRAEISKLRKDRSHRALTVVEVSTKVTALAIEDLVGPLLDVLRAVELDRGRPYSNFTADERLFAAHFIARLFDQKRAILERGKGRPKKRSRAIGIVNSVRQESVVERVAHARARKNELRRALIRWAAGTKFGAFINSEEKHTTAADVSTLFDAKKYVRAGSKIADVKGVRSDAGAVRNFIETYGLDPRHQRRLQKFLSRNKRAIFQVLDEALCKP